MYIERIEVKNFKSFEKLELELGNFNVVIGPNASGKTNFIHIFEFLRDIINFGLDNAISLQGGTEYIRNMKIRTTRDLSLRVTFSQPQLQDEEPPVTFLRSGERLRAVKVEYEFRLRFDEKGPLYRVVKDELKQKYSIYRKKGAQMDVTLKVFRKNEKLDYQIEPPDTEYKKIIEYMFPFLLREKERKVQGNSLLIETPVFSFLTPLGNIFREIAIYDFDPRLPKRAIPITAKAELEENGQNLPIVVKNILENERNRKKFLNLVRELLPFVESLDIEKLVDKSLLFKIRENYFEDYIPAPLISDGTINIIALVLVLYLEKKRLIIIEEPERNIHPYLISKIVDMMKDASREKQIVVTTHNPEFVKYAGLNNLLFAFRDEKGFSRIERPANKEEIKVFLENEIGIDELYVQNLL
ncbi:MAG TPA: ATPase [Thermotogae bacterium]|nr:ATPase [Thermotogota bacterium]